MLLQEIIRRKSCCDQYVWVKGLGRIYFKKNYELSPWYQPDGKRSDQKAIKVIKIAMDKGFNCFEWAHKRINGEEFLVTVFLGLTKAKPCN